MQTKTVDVANPYLCFSLVVKCEDVVSPASLALSDQKHSMSLWSRALNQIGCLDSGDGPVEPGVGEQEVIGLLDNLLWWGEGEGNWREEQRHVFHYRLICQDINHNYLLINSAAIKFLHKNKVCVFI